MTERKPPGVTFETWIDQQIRRAQERGDFDDLPGTGKPLPGLDRPVEEQWWLKNYLRREGLSAEALLPTPLQLRRETERLPDTVRDLPTEQEVREVVEELNRRIVDWMRAPSGPQVPVGPVNADDVVRQWRTQRNPARGDDAGPGGQPAPPPPPRRWWHRIVHPLRRAR